MRLHIARLSGCVPQGKITERESRRTYAFNDIFCATHDDCWDAVGLKMTCDQTHGLMTHWSIGDDDGDVAAIFTYSFVYLGTIDFHRALLAAIGRRTIETLGNAADHAFTRQAL